MAEARRYPFESLSTAELVVDATYGVARADTPAMTRCFSSFAAASAAFRARSRLKEGGYEFVVPYFGPIWSRLGGRLGVGAASLQPLRG